MAAKKTAAAAKVRLTVAAHKHKDKRSNIPTEELRDFVADEELAPRKILYPRDPSLDPQLVWKGKDAYYRSYGLTYALPARAFRLGLQLEDGTRVFTSMENVAKLGVVEPTQADISEWVKWNNPHAYNGKDGKMVN